MPPIKKKKTKLQKIVDEASKSESDELIEFRTKIQDIVDGARENLYNLQRALSAIGHAHTELDQACNPHNDDIPF